MWYNLCNQLVFFIIAKNIKVLTFLIDVPVLGILVLSSLILLPVLLPVAATDTGGMKLNSTTSNVTFSDLDKLSMGNVKVSYIIFFVNNLVFCVFF